MVGSRFFVEVWRHRVPDQIFGNSALAPRSEVKSALAHTHRFVHDWQCFHDTLRFNRTKDKSIFHARHRSG